ncbi:GNAT family N-acetyltransferase [Taibaiella chishuiensis]|uniref:RimJ/RimL family protein N-acetyltransferase n=1 Tax=Taibaiella chishuiensis TaxID=1434707 RepID=A0A2P8D9V1_9BACT|nr:GNAT family protein [Taibaiella chishuiensis]PSK93951.1 RimJ/RimL family protein N-acetyltransferase [Taibaiella chishuiensis]
MNFSPTLENRRALLRPMQLSDVALLAPLALGEPELYRYMSAVIGNEDDLLRFVTEGIQDREAGKCIPFVVIDKQQDAIAGATRFGNLELRHKRVEIGWTWIGSAFQGTGLNKAMKYLMLEHAFSVMEMNRVEIKTNEDNTRSRRAIESIGGRFEGIFRHHMVNPDGSLRNTVYYSILKEEWPELKAGLFARYNTGW